MYQEQCISLEEELARIREEERVRREIFKVQNSLPPLMEWEVQMVWGMLPSSSKMPCPVPIFRIALTRWGGAYR